MALAGTQHVEKTGDVLTIDIKGGDSGAQGSGAVVRLLVPRCDARDAGSVCFEPRTTASSGSKGSSGGPGSSCIGDRRGMASKLLVRSDIVWGKDGKGDKKDDELATDGHEPAVESGLSPPVKRAEQPTRQAKDVASHHEPQRGGN